MQPVLNVEDIKRVEIALTRVGVSVSDSCTVQVTLLLKRPLAWEGISLTLSSS